MRYLSDDGKVFQTEQECLEHEKKQKVDQARKTMETEIAKKRQELEQMTAEYRKKYGSSPKTESLDKGDILSVLFEL
nr:MAG TPA: hypothetical protein [Caudoviricetes sp.]